MIRIFGLIVILFCLILTLSAQENQYVVKINGDTIYGKIMINPVRDNSRSMFFKAVDGSKSNISPLRYHYVYYNPKYQFRSVPLYNQKLFMQVIREDEKLSLYNFVHQRDNNIVTSKVLFNADGESVELSGLNFKNQMTSFIEDCPEILAKVGTKEFRYKNHEELVASYNLCESHTESVNPVVTEKVDDSPEGETGPISAPATLLKKDPQQDKLSILQSFREYAGSLRGFQFTDDVLELLTDLENRIRQNSEIPSYLWSSLDAMVEDHPELKMKAQKLKLDLN